MAPLSPEGSILANFAKTDYHPHMTTMNISLPDALKAFVDDQVTRRGYGTSSEYVRDLIRKDHDRQRLRGSILEGAESPISGEADSAYFEELRRRAAKGQRKRTAKR